MTNQPLASAPTAATPAPRTNIDLATLTPLVCDAIGAKLAAQATFTAYDITTALRDANPTLNIEHVAVKGLVRTILRLGAVLSGAYTETSEPQANGGNALTYTPVQTVTISAPAAPVAGLLPAPAPFNPVV